MTLCKTFLNPFQGNDPLLHSRKTSENHSLSNAFRGYKNGLYKGNIRLPVDIGRKLNVRKTFRRRPGRLLNVLCTFNLRPMSTGICSTLVKVIAFKNIKFEGKCKGFKFFQEHSCFSITANCLNSRSSHRRHSIKKVFLKIWQNSQENTCVCNFIKKETLAHVLSCEFCEMFKNTFFTEHPPDDCFCSNQLIKDTKVFRHVSLKIKIHSKVPS